MGSGQGEGALQEATARKLLFSHSISLYSKLVKSGVVPNRTEPASIFIAIRTVRRLKFGAGGRDPYFHCGVRAIT
jgi:hypothetical protein